METTPAQSSEREAIILPSSCVEAVGNLSFEDLSVVLYHLTGGGGYRSPQ